MEHELQILAEFLGRLEQAEARLLSWGLVDGSFTEEELYDRVEDFLSERDVDGHFSRADDLVDLLMRRGLLFSLLNDTEQRYRTRMGEAVRLLARLRQLFPKHRDGRVWQAAATLVADFRLLLRPRQFPQRTIELSVAEDVINESRRLDALQRDVLGAILDRDGQSPVRLADFQLRATRTILSHTGSRQANGTIVCAGTGSGKTLSFYLPAFLHLAPTLDSSRWTRCLALYPRNELLKDQLSETYRQARRIDSVLARNRRRKLVIGTLFGSTPHNPHSFNGEKLPNGWERHRDGFVCPYLKCPTSDCSGELVWRDADRNAGVERLCCGTCRCATESDELILTRERMLSEPPDILFTTTEMLNQRMGDSRFAHLFGIATEAQRKPPLVLLDEVHTYSGVSGAQVGLLLRRWRRAARNQPHFVGLSATLTDARRFFARLIGVDDFRVHEITPHPNEMNRSGMEYMLAVRGDPASGTSLLSTTIQTVMLMRRVQDASDRPCSEGLYGTRAFVFTDDLDVTNRLYFNVLDAEGLDSWGRRNPQRPDGSLANLRRSDLSEPALRQRFGQSWGLCEEIGHSLRGDTFLQIGRTSSQDSGVTAGSDVVVATASLEVGFNDPEVNVVVQHKAPRDPAQFLQRKGRAGRRTEMRPWTIVVLSDYGRDRLAWQSYDLLFDPELPPRDLPVANRYVLRMQAVFAFMDWVAEQLRRDSGTPAGSVWQDFSAPSAKLAGSYRSTGRQRQLTAANLIEDLLVREDRHEEVSQYLQEALRIDSGVAEALMWEPPRALMTAVLPTLFRRLRSDWRRAGFDNDSDRGQFDYYVPNNPLPEFVPGRLFADLNLPEVTIVTPSQQRNDEAREEPLPILQAMREFAPGRVSRRFGIRNQWARHWIAPPDVPPGPLQHLPLDRYVARFDELGEFQYADHDGETRTVRCVRPYELHPQQPPGHVQDMSNAFLVWQTQIVPDTDGLAVDLPSPSCWELLISEIRFFTHCHHAPLEIRRFSMTSEATVVLRNGQQLETEIDFVERALDTAEANTSEPVPVAVGFTADCDGVVFRFRKPEQSTLTSAPASLLRGLRTTLFRDRVTDDASLNGIANSFKRQWLAEVYVAALVHASLLSEHSLFDTWQASGETNFDDVLQIMFQSIAVTTDGADDSGAADAVDSELDEVHQRLFVDLSALLHEPQVIETLRRHAPVLWAVPDENWANWLDRKFATTLGAALLDAVQQLCPDLDVGDLTLDIDAGPRPPGSVACPDDLKEIWLTERTVGGGGVIENFLSRYGEDPRRFFDLVEAALKPSDFEIADEQLTLFLDWIADAADSSVREAVGVVRQAMGNSHDAYAAAFEGLIRLLSAGGLFVCHSVVAALGTRILKPGSTPQTDEMLHELVHDWRNCEELLGIEIDSRVFASLRADSEGLDAALGELESDALEIDPRQWRFSAILSVLWPRGSVIRSRRLSVYNPFSRLPATERDLVRNAIAHDTGIIDVTLSDWREEADLLLVRDGSVILRSPAAESGRLRTAILSMIATPVDSGFMLLHPRVRGIDRGTGFVDVTVDLAEAMQ